MYKLNKEWAQHLVDEGYTILDMGDFNNLGFSAFYSMKKQQYLSNGTKKNRHSYNW